MNDLETQLREALADDAERAPLLPPVWDGPTVTVVARRTRSQRGRLLAVAAIILAGSVTTGVVAYARIDSHRSRVTGDTTPHTTAKDAERAAAEKERARREAQAIAAYQQAIRRAAETKLAKDLVAAARPLGWSINLPSDVVSQTSSGATTDKLYVEIRVRDAGVGELLVSVNTGDPDAVAAGTQNRTGLLRTEGTASVYLGTGGPNETAVELFDGTTIIYVRSESTTSNARPVADLTDIALTIDKRRG